MRTRKSSPKRRNARRQVFVIPNARDYSTEMKNAMSDTQAMLAGFAYPSNEQPTAKSDEAPGFRADSRKPTGPFEAQSRLVQQFWQLWYEAPARLWESLTMPARAWWNLINVASQSTSGKDRTADN